MTELLPKPRREDFISRDDSGHLKINAEGYAVALCEYYKRLAEFAIEALKVSIRTVELQDVYVTREICLINIKEAAEEALSRIKQSEQL